MQAGGPRPVISRPHLPAHCHLKTGGDCGSLCWGWSHDWGQMRATSVSLLLSGQGHSSSQLLHRSYDAHKASECENVLEELLVCRCKQTSPVWSTQDIPPKGSRSHCSKASPKPPPTRFPFPPSFLVRVSTARGKRGIDGESITVKRIDQTEGCQSSLAQTLPPEEAPVDRPYWSNDDPDMPLPFDLSDIISRVESLLWRM
ncbi:hypothetical protein SRHO_G00307360 [Serrasalmus rhombeus]